MVLTLSYLIFSLLSVFKLFPAALQTVTKKIVQSRANSTLVGVFTILLLFISSFANMVGTTALHFVIFCIMEQLGPMFQVVPHDEIREGAYIFALEIDQKLQIFLGYFVGFLFSALHLCLCLLLFHLYWLTVK